MAMKKIYLLAFAAIFAASCSIEVADNPVESTDSQVVTSLNATVEGGIPSRTVRNSDGSVSWLPGDALSVFSGNGTAGGAKFTTDISEPQASAQFTGNLTITNTSANYWALYPYGEDVYCDGSNIYATLPSTQTAAHDSFADDLFISVYKGRSTNMTFKNVTGGIKFTVESEGITSVILQALDNEALTGTAAISIPTSGIPTVKRVESPSSKIVLNAPEGETFIPGKAYHFVTLPVVLSKGIALTFVKDGQKAIKVFNTPSEIKRSGFRTITSADKDATWFNVSSNTFRVAPTQFNLTGNSQTVIVTAYSTSDYHVDVTADWIASDGSPIGSPEGGYIHFIKVNANVSGAKRTGVASFCTEMTCHPVIITQDVLDITAGNIVHHSLGQRFTATWCGYCPNMSESFKLAKEQLGDKLYYVNLHPSSSDLAFSGTAVWENLYDIPGYPCAYIDGRRLVQNYANATAAQTIAGFVSETESNYPVATGIGISSSLSGSSLSVHVDVYSKQAEDYKITALVLESDIVHSQNNNYISAGVDPNYVHDNIARIALTSSIGDAFSAGKEDLLSFDYTATIPSAYNKDNLSILVWVMRKYGTQTILRDADYGEYYVDNCRVAAVGETAGLEFE